MPARALVCLHGLGGSASEWEPVAGRLGLGAVHPSLPDRGPAVVVGHSFGGVAALRMAAAHPDAVEAVVLTASFWPPARNGRPLAAAVADYAGHRVAYVREVARRRERDRPRRADIHGLIRLAALGVRPGAFHATAAAVRAPVLVIHGTADHVVPIAFARAAARAHPAWTLSEVADGGHQLHRQRPQEWAAIVTDWLGWEAGAR